MEFPITETSIDTKKEIGQLLVEYTQDAPAEAALCFRAFALPGQAEETLRPALPMLHPMMKLMAECLLDVAERGTPSHRTLLNAAIHRGFNIQSFHSAWSMMLMEDGWLWREPEACMKMIQEAFLDETREAGINELLKLAHDPPAYRERLRGMLADEEIGSPRRVLIPVESLDELAAADIPPAESLLGDGLLNRGGLMWIHANSGTGKTFLALQLAASMALARPWLRWKVDPTPKTILYLQGELSRSWWQRRAKMLRTFYDVEYLRGVYFCHRIFPLMTHDHWKRTVSCEGLGRLAALVEEHEPDVVFLDPLSAFYALKENDTDLNREFVNQILEFRRKYNMTIVIVHHDRKGQEKATSEMRGSSVLEAGADSSLQLTKDFKKKITKLQWTKVRHAMTPSLMRLEQTEKNRGFFTEAAEEAKK